MSPPGAWPAVLRRPLRATAAALVTIALLTGCATSQRDQVKAKVEQFVNAVAAKDYKTICQQVLSEELLLDMREGGIRCEQALQISLGSLKSPSLAIGPISVNGDTASAVTLSGAKGEDAALASLELLKTPAGWRVNALGSPLKK
jgi:ketosteroid isomerase-like protein